MDTPETTQDSDVIANLFAEELAEAGVDMSAGPLTDGMQIVRGLWSNDLIPKDIQEQISDVLNYIQATGKLPSNANEVQRAVFSAFMSTPGAAELWKEAEVLYKATPDAQDKLNKIGQYIHDADSQGRTIPTFQDFVNILAIYGLDKILNAPVANPVRKGSRLTKGERVKFRAPTAEPAKDFVTSFFSRRWGVTAARDAAYCKQGDTNVVIEHDPALGFGPEEAVNQIVQYGPSIAQTFLAMTGLWFEQNRGKPRETYLTAYASDILRFQGKKEENGGYQSEATYAQARNVSLLRRMSIPTAQIKRSYNKKTQINRVSIDSLFVVQNIDIEQVTSDDLSSTSVAFRYHLGRELYDWVTDETPQFTEMSSKILGYHPSNQKYHILLGFCLSYYDRVNRKNKKDVREIQILSLLNMADIEVPERNVDRFVEQIKRALNQLQIDGVIPGLCISNSEIGSQKSAREALRSMSVSFPRMVARR